MSGEAQLDLSKDELFELTQILIELADPKYVEMYQTLADFIQDNIYLFPVEESEEILRVQIRPAFFFYLLETWNAEG